MSVASLLTFTLLLAPSVLGQNTTVAVLGGHSPTAWKKGNCTANSRATVACNLKIYELAVTTAKQNGAQLLVFPEGAITIFWHISMLAKLAFCWRVSFTKIWNFILILDVYKN